MVELEPVFDEAGPVDAERALTDLEADNLSDVMADLLSGDEQRLRFLIERHLHYTGSERARAILNDWQAISPKFIKIMPIDYRRAMLEAQNQKQAKNQAKNQTGPSDQLNVAAGE